MGLAPVVLAGSIEGRWLLTEQYYGDGGSNLVSDAELPLHLAFVRDAEGLHGFIWRGTDRLGAQAWPSLTSAAGAGPASVERLDLAADESGISASYTAAPSATDDLLLRVVERYTVVDDGRALAGHVEVTFVRDGESKGSYVLRRRFERKP
jgi:hypothetical protein